jgi:F-type H+-transporting ATPase subunit alpha
MAVEEQVVVIFAGTRGYLDRVEVGNVTRFETALLGEVKANHPDLLEAIRTNQEVTPEVEKGLVEFLDGFAKTFA